MGDIKSHTLHLTNGALLALYHASKDSKWYSEVIDLVNASAICSLIEKRQPLIKLREKLDAELVKQKKDIDAWLLEPRDIKLSESLRETAKKTIESHIKQGQFNGSDYITQLCVELGLTKMPDVSGLLDDLEEAAPAAAAAAG